MSAIDYEDGLYDKIGGWLVLPAFLHPLLAIGFDIKGVTDILSLPWDTASLSAQIFFGSILVVGLLSAFLWGLSAYFAGTLNPIFPKFYIWLTIGEIATFLAAMLILYYAFNVSPSASDWKDLARSVSVAMIWIPYMLISKRVKATFYNIPMPERFIHKDVGSPLRQYVEETKLLREEERQHQEPLTMVQRLGMVLYWGGTGLAAILLVLGLFALANAPDKFVAIASLIGAALVWLIGRAIKFVIVGK